MIKKSLIALFTVLLLVISILAEMQVAEIVEAKPSAPQFTIKLQDNSTIQLMIGNQPFTNSSDVNSLLYKFRVKDHYSDKWVIAESIDHLQSSSTTTEITISLEQPLLPPPANYTVLDFQLQATTGFYSITYKPGYIPGAPTQFQSGDGYSEITFNPAETSEWSNTQTVNLNQTSTIIPELSWLAILPLFTSILFISVKLKQRKSSR